MIFDQLKDKYTPKIWAYALSLYAHQSIRISEPFSGRFFKLAVQYKDVFDDIIRSSQYIHIDLTESQIQKQLEFMGYEKNLKTHNLYAYVSSNRQINGHWYILNKKFTDNIYSIEKRQSYPYIYDTWDDYALEGYTKILTHGTKP